MTRVRKVVGALFEALHVVKVLRQSDGSLDRTAVVRHADFAAWLKKTGAAAASSAALISQQSPLEAPEAATAADSDRSAEVGSVPVQGTVPTTPPRAQSASSVFARLGQPSRRRLVLGPPPTPLDSPSLGTPYAPSSPRAPSSPLNAYSARRASFQSNHRPASAGARLGVPTSLSPGLQRLASASTATGASDDDRSVTPPRLLSKSGTSPGASPRARVVTCEAVVGVAGEGGAIVGGSVGGGDGGEARAEVTVFTIPHAAPDDHAVVVAELEQGEPPPRPAVAAQSAPHAAVTAASHSPRRNWLSPGKTKSLGSGRSSGEPFGSRASCGALSVISSSASSWQQQQKSQREPRLGSPAFGSTRPRLATRESFGNRLASESTPHNWPTAVGAGRVEVSTCRGDADGAAGNGGVPSHERSFMHDGPVPPDSPLSVSDGRWPTQRQGRRFTGGTVECNNHKEQPSRAFAPGYFKAPLIQAAYAADRYDPKGTPQAAGALLQSTHPGSAKKTKDSPTAAAQHRAGSGQARSLAAHMAATPAIGTGRALWPANSQSAPSSPRSGAVVASPLYHSVPFSKWIDASRS